MEKGENEMQSHVILLQIVFCMRVCALDVFFFLLLLQALWQR